MPRSLNDLFHDQQKIKPKNVIQQTPVHSTAEAAQYFNNQLFFIGFESKSGTINTLY